MANYSMNYDHAERVIIPNDAFFYLKDDEPMIDETNIRFVHEINRRFQNGFHIDDDWCYVDEENGLIDALFIPYEEDTFQYNLYIDLFNNWYLQIDWDGVSSECIVRYANTCKQPMEPEVCKILYNDGGKQYIQTEKGSIYHFWKAIRK
jgi:hypothetical protein